MSCLKRGLKDIIASLYILHVGHQSYELGISFGIRIETNYNCLKVELYLQVGHIYSLFLDCGALPLFPGVYFFAWSSTNNLFGHIILLYVLIFTTA
jgi:hypothetical protein